MTFEPDQTVYLPDGREAVYVLANGQEHRVRFVYEGFDPEEGSFIHHGRVVSVPAVFAVRPTEAEQRAAKIAKLHEEIKKLEAEE
jgi:hypothetical protein